MFLESGMLSMRADSLGHRQMRVVGASVSPGAFRFVEIRQLTIVNRFLAGVKLIC